MANAVAAALRHAVRERSQRCFFKSIATRVRKRDFAWRKVIWSKAIIAGAGTNGLESINPLPFLSIQNPGARSALPTSEDDLLVMGRLLASSVLERDGYRVIGSTVGFHDSHVVVLVTASGGKRPRLTLEPLQFFTPNRIWYQLPEKRMHLLPHIIGILNFSVRRHKSGDLQPTYLIARSVVDDEIEPWRDMEDFPAELSAELGAQLGEVELRGHRERERKKT
jgi:hypothetical protein